jgi:hypothetical protein
MSDEPSLKTAKEAAEAYQGAKDALNRMIRESGPVLGWLHDTREIVLTWIAKACQVTFKSKPLNELWRPLSGGAPSLIGPTCQVTQAAVLVQVKLEASILALARSKVDDPVTEDFPMKVLAAVGLVEKLDATLARVNGGDLNGAFRCFEGFSLAEILEDPDPYRAANS